MYRSNLLTFHSYWVTIYEDSVHFTACTESSQKISSVITVPKNCPDFTAVLISQVVLLHTISIHCIQPHFHFLHRLQCHRVVLRAVTIPISIIYEVFSSHSYWWSQPTHKKRKCAPLQVEQMTFQHQKNEASSLSDFSLKILHCTSLFLTLPHQHHPQFYTWSLFTVLF